MKEYSNIPTYEYILENTPLVQRNYLYMIPYSLRIRWFLAILQVVVTFFIDISIIYQAACACMNIFIVHNDHEISSVLGSH